MSRTWVAISVVVTVGVLAGGWLAAKAFESPAQREARARPPDPRPIVVRVTKGTLADEITARADVAPAITDRLTPQALPPRAVVTARLVGKGSGVWPGTVVLTINGRPLLVLPGRFSFYRDIVAGMDGPDVAQLQAGLAAAGYPASPGEAGVYGPATQDAVRGLYRAAGAQPLTRAPARANDSDVRPRAAAPLPMLPLSEVVVAPHLPAKVASIVGVGAQISADRPALRLASGNLVAHAGVAPSVVGRVRPGMSAELIADDGPSMAARVVAVNGAHRSGDRDLRDVSIAPISKRLPAKWIGANVLARITTTLVGRRALIVPTRAVARGADGTAYVLKQTRDGEFVRIHVRTLGSLAGRTAVAPQSRGALLAADHIRVG
jgi:hypothetical protein